MNSKLRQSIRAALLIPVSALCLLTLSQAQTAQPMAPSASMPMGHMQSGAAGSGDMKQSMMSGMDSMKNMPMSGNTDKDFAMIVNADLNLTHFPS